MDCDTPSVYKTIAKALKFDWSLSIIIADSIRMPPTDTLSKKFHKGPRKTQFWQCPKFLFDEAKVGI